MRIAICAAIGCENLGDELILKNEIFLLESHYSHFFKIPKEEIEFIVFSYNVKKPFFTKSNVYYKEYFPVGIRNPKNLLRNLKNFFSFLYTLSKSKLLVIGGGGIFYDTELQSQNSPLSQIYMRVWLAKIFHVSVEIFRVGVDIQTQKNSFLLQKICESASIISVRDTKSFLQINALGFGNKLSLEKDPVFFDKEFSKKTISGRSLGGYAPKEQSSYYRAYLNTDTLNLHHFKKILQSRSISLAGKRVGFALRKSKQEGYIEHCADIVEYMIELGAQVICVPHSFHPDEKESNDKIFYEEIIELLPFGIQKRVTLSHSLEDSYSIYINKKVDIMIAQRLHSIILSAVYGIDFIAVSYAQKTEEILKQL